MTRSRELTNWVAEKYRNHPYFDHCLAVAQTAAPAHPLAYEVGLCHDMLEDGIVTADELHLELERLGYCDAEARQILAAVQELTDVYTETDFPNLTKKQRRRHEANRLAGTGPLAQTVKYADLIDGARWIKENRPEKWDKYARRKRKLLELITLGKPNLRKAALMTFN